jgi:hypothetical protein
MALAMWKRGCQLLWLGASLRQLPFNRMARRRLSHVTDRAVHDHPSLRARNANTRAVDEVARAGEGLVDLARDYAEMLEVSDA